MSVWKKIVGRSFTANGFDLYLTQIKLTVWRPTFVVLHNTWKPKLSDWHGTPGSERMKNLVHHYRDEMGWSGGPHLIVADDLIWVFTPLDVSGVHSPSWNSKTWGVEMVGDYETEEFNKNVRSNTIHALAALHSAAGLNPNTLKLHKEDPKTTHQSCPGKNVNKFDIIHGVVLEMAFREFVSEMRGVMDVLKAFRW